MASRPSPSALPRNSLPNNNKTLQDNVFAIIHHIGGSGGVLEKHHYLWITNESEILIQFATIMESSQNGQIGSTKVTVICTRTVTKYFLYWME